MNYCKKRDRFEASNVYFREKEVYGVSYNWWVFVKKIKGLVVFNDYNYSRSTIKHQNKVRRLLRELGINVDRTVFIRASLENINSLKALKEAELMQAKMNAVNDERKRIERNKKARERRRRAKELLAQKQAVPALMVINGGLQ